jgi:hypothetical protein
MISGNYESKNPYRKGDGLYKAMQKMKKETPIDKKNVGKPTDGNSKTKKGDFDFSSLQPQQNGMWQIDSPSAKSIGDSAMGSKNTQARKYFTVRTSSGHVKTFEERWFLNADKVNKKGDRGILDPEIAKGAPQYRDLGFVSNGPLEVIKIDSSEDTRLFTIRSSDGKIKKLGESWFLNSDDVGKVGDKAYLTPYDGSEDLDRVIKEGFKPGVGYEVIKVE